MVLYTNDTDGAFSIMPGLAEGEGAHTLSAVAENASGQGPASASLALTVDPDLPYDPLGVRAGEWSKDGWLLGPPRDSEGCADPTNGGTYRVVAEKEGYPTYTSPDLVVVDTPVRHNIPLRNFKVYLPLVVRQ